MTLLELPTIPVLATTCGFSAPYITILMITVALKDTMVRCFS